MNMIDLLRGAQGGQGLDNLARQHGLSRSQLEQVLGQVLPAVSSGFKRQARQPSGLDGLLRKIQGTDMEDVYQDPRALERNDVKSRGNDILGQIFGSKDVSRSVAARAEQNSGVSAGVVKSMLPMIVSMVMGGMQKKTSTDQSMGGALDGLIRGAMGQQSSGGGGLGDLLGGMLGGGGAGRAQPRQPQGGGGLGDLLGGMLGGAAAQPNRAPERRGGGGLNDILGDAMGGQRRQAQAAPEPQGGGGIGDLLGGIFGASPRERKSSGDAGLDNVIGMFDADGDGRVDDDILRDFTRRR